MKQKLNVVGWLSLCLLWVMPAWANVSSEEVSQAVEALEQHAVLIDVRTAEEFQIAHIEGAINIPYESIVDGVHAHKLMPNTPIVVYCRSGRRSGIAQQSLLQAGYRHTLNGGAFEVLNQAILQAEAN